MIQHACDELQRFGRKTKLLIRIIEGIFTIFEKRHIGVHAIAGHAKQRLGHKGSMQLMLLRDGLDCQLEGDNVVGSGQGFGIFEIDLMLAWRTFMVRSFDLKAHFLQGQTDGNTASSPISTGPRSK